jgi:hypothetical protein
MPKYVLKADLPEVTVSAERLLVDDEILHFMESSWTAEDHRQKGMAHLAIAEYLDNLKPQLPTEPGSVILAMKITDYTIRPSGIYVSRRYDGKWQSLTFSDVFNPSEIEEWKPVQLTVVEAF